MVAVISQTRRRPIRLTRPARVLALFLSGVILTFAAALIGSRHWPVPDRVLSGWQVSHVPGVLWGLLGSATLACLVVAAILTLPVRGLRSSQPIALAWLGVVVLAALALDWNALVAAADSRFAGAPIPIFHWAFTLTAGLLAGMLAARGGAGDGAIAAIGSGVVTVPLFALGWALLVSDDETPRLTGVLDITFFLGVIPLAIATGLAAIFGAAFRSGAP